MALRKPSHHVSVIPRSHRCLITSCLLTSYAACTTDVCALQRHLNMLTYHKGLPCFFGMMLYRHLLAHMQMLEMTLFKPSFVDAVFPFMLFAYQPWPSLPHSAAVSHSLHPSSYFKTLFTRLATSWQRYLHCPFQAGAHPSQAVLCTFTELQALLHSVNQPKQYLPFKSNYLP